MVDWITNLVNNLGYVGLAFLTFVENVFPPIPSEIIMPLGGFLAAQGKLTWLGVTLAGTAGSVIGGLALFGFGRLFTEEWILNWIERYGRWFLLTTDDIEKAFNWFDRYDYWAVFLARLVPGVRSLISIPAGSRRMNLIPFIAFTAVGTAIWSGLLAYAGMLLGAEYERIAEYIDIIKYLVLGGLVALALLWFVRRLWQRRQMET